MKEKDFTKCFISIGIWDQKLSR